MSKTLLIHHGNVPSVDTTHSIKFDVSSADVDSYISTVILPKIKECEFDVIFIKDSLSENYLELYGLRVAYHIRLSVELDKKRFVPIVILSDVDAYVLNRLSTTARILFTKNISLIKNDKEMIERKLKSDFKPFNQERFKEDFLEKIEVAKPEESSSHDIVNEWAIHQWAELLDVKNQVIKTNDDKISSMLYFKYIKNQYSYHDKDKESYQIKPLSTRGDILYIDDEWDKGWSDIMIEIFSTSSDVALKPLPYDYKDTNKFKIMIDIKKEIIEDTPDVIILDLRLTKTDHTHHHDIDSYTGIKLVNLIKEINPGIQIIMLTATSQSSVLEKLYDYGILGYIKKEHPDEFSHVGDDIDKLMGLVDKGLAKKYLKEIWLMQEEILALPFTEDNRIFELKNTLQKVFDILNSNIPDKEIFAGLSIFKCLEIIISYYIQEVTRYDQENKKNIFEIYWKDIDEKIDMKFQTIENKMKKIFDERLDIASPFLEDELKKIVCFRNYNSHAGVIKNHCKDVLVKKPQTEDLQKWFKMLKDIIVSMDKQA